MELTGKALIRKTGRAPRGPGRFDRAVTVSPQAGPRGRNTEQKPCCSTFNINNSPRQRRDRGRRACVSEDEGLCAVAVVDDSAESQLPGSNDLFLEAAAGNPWS